ncbi:MAG: carbohydrate ABC transporter permease [Beutenbergiaceae bacterium]
MAIAAPTIRKQKHGSGETAVAVLSHVGLGIWSIIVVAPLLWVFLSAFKTDREIISGSPLSLPQQWSFANFGKAWVDEKLGQAMFNTVVVVACALILVMLLGAMCAYVLARFDFFGRRAIYYLMLAGLTFPVFLAIVPLFFVLQGLGALNTLPGLILTYVAFALPFTVFFLYAFFQSLPGEISEAAAIDGAGQWRTFFQVMLPMATSGMASVAIFNFLGLWNQYLLPVALNTSRDNWVLSQAVASFVSSAGYQSQFGLLFAGVVITIVPVLIAYIIFQRQLQGSVSQGTNK